MRTEEMTSRWRKLDSEESFIIYELHMQQDDMGGCVARMTAMRDEYKILVGEP